MKFEREPDFVQLSLMRFGVFILLSLLTLSGLSQKHFFEHHHSCSEFKTSFKSQQDMTSLNPLNVEILAAELKLSCDPEKDTLYGEVAHLLRATQGLDSIMMDLSSNLLVDSVYDNSGTLQFSHNGENLIVYVSAIESDSIVFNVAYKGVPEAGGLGTYSKEPHNGYPMIWTLSQPYGAREWWPCFQSGGIKYGEVSVELTVPDLYIPVSNGLKQQEEVSGGKRTIRYAHTYPIPAYLVAFAVTNYKMDSYYLDMTQGPLLIENYLFEEEFDSVMREVHRVDTPLLLFDTLFGPYPFMGERYGHASFTRGGGMEHTTISFMGNFGVNLVVHELAHHWFGDYVTCGSWEDIWLNEGFATYSEGLYYERFEGSRWWLPWKEWALGRATEYDTGSVYVYDTTVVSRVFNSRLSYAKGAMVMHTLRYQIGDKAFFNALKMLLNEHGFGHIRTPDLMDAFKAQTDYEIDGFFEKWIYGEGVPEFSMEWERTESGIMLSVNQQGTHESVPFFPMSFPVRLVGTFSDTVIRLNQTMPNQVFEITPGFRVSSIEADPEIDVLARFSSPTGPTVETEVLIYPIPTQSNLYIESPADPIQWISVLDLSGRQMLSEEYPDDTYSLVINAKEFRKDILILEVVTANRTVTKKILFE